MKVCFVNLKMMQAGTAMLIALTTKAFANSEEHREIMKVFSLTFGRKMFECGEMTKYSREMALDILYYWDMTRPLDNTDTGCLVICAMVKLELLDSEGDLIRPNAEGYLYSTGADDDTTTFLIELFIKCKYKNSSILNGCKMALETSKCFRQGVYRKSWTPDVRSLWKLPYDT